MKNEATKLPLNLKAGDRVLVEATIDVPPDENGIAEVILLLDDNCQTLSIDDHQLRPYPTVQSEDDAGVKVGFILAELIMDVVMVEHENPATFKYDTKDTVARILEACKPTVQAKGSVSDDMVQRALDSLVIGPWEPGDENDILLDHERMREALLAAFNG